MEGECGPKGFGTGGSLNIAWCSQCPALTPILNERQGPDSPVWWLGDRVSLALGLGGPQSPSLWCQAPWEGPNWADLWLGLPPGGPQMRADGCGACGVAVQNEDAGEGEHVPKGFGMWAFEYCLVLAVPCLFSHTECAVKP